MKKTYALVFIILFSFVSFANNTLTSLELNQITKTAKICASPLVFVENEIFYHPDFHGYIIKISGDNSIFEGIGDNTEVCVAGPYRIDSRGFAPHLYINDIAVVSEQPGNTDTPLFSLGKLNQEDRLRKKVDEVNTEWSDGNITTGTSSVISGRVVSKINEKNLKNLSQFIFLENLKYFVDYENDQLPSDSKINTTVYNYHKKSLNLTSTALADGNAFSPEYEEGILIFEKDLKAMANLLGANKSIKVLVTKTRMADEEDMERLRTVYSIVYININTQKYFNVFVVEGTM